MHISFAPQEEGDGALEIHSKCALSGNELCVLYANLIHHCVFTLRLAYIFSKPHNHACYAREKENCSTAVGIKGKQQRENVLFFIIHEHILWILIQFKYQTRAETFFAANVLDELPYCMRTSRSFSFNLLSTNDEDSDDLARGANCSRAELSCLEFIFKSNCSFDSLNWKCHKQNKEICGGKSIKKQSTLIVVADKRASERIKGCFRKWSEVWPDEFCVRGIKRMLNDATSLFIIKA